MMEATRDGGGGVSFPVVFFNGECETIIGNVVFYELMDLKAFQSILSRKIGILPYQFSVYNADRNDSRNRIPITGKVNLSAFSCEMDSYLLVVLKRSQRSETRKGKHEEPSLPAAAMKKEPPANILLLRRGSGGGNNLMDSRVFTGFDGFDRPVRDLQMEKVRYLVNMGRTNLRIERELKSLVCEDCEKAKVVGRDVGFHWCVYDGVTLGFRSNLGQLPDPEKVPLNKKNRFWWKNEKITLVLA